MNLLSLFSQSRERNQAEQLRTENQRLQQYARYMRAYEGYSVRGVTNTNVVSDWKRLKFNYNHTIINLSAGWFAAKPLDWMVDGDPKATAAAYQIWDRSGSDACLLESALLCGIYGDMVGLATQDKDGACIEFIDPSICTPTFEGSDYSRLRAVEIAYEETRPDGEFTLRREMWMPNQMHTFEGDLLVEHLEYSDLPAVWIRNSSVKGNPWGVSDIEPVLELVEEYDHLCAKQTRIIDYYASPNIVFEGVQKGTLSVEKSVGTIYYVPAGGRAYFLEWSGSGPEIEQQLTRCRNAIAEISQVPAVAFGQADSGLTSISGVALKILYGPLINKTHRKQASWGPALQYLMWLCLRHEGHNVPRSAVHVLFPNSTPVDGQAAVAEASGKVAARVSSRRTVMNDLGIENPDLELLRIVLEEKILQLSNQAKDLAQDTNRAASLGAHGRFVQQNPAEAGMPADPAAVSLGDVTSTNAADIGDLIGRFDALVASESASFSNPMED